MKKVNWMKKAALALVIFALILGSAFAYPPVNDDFLHTEGGRVIDKNGREVWLTGINWFGFETADHVVHGLWSRNWKDVINEIASLGFNLVRMPVSVTVVDSWKNGAPILPSKIEYGLNADLEGLDSLQIFDKIHDYMEKVGLKIMLDMHSVHDVDHKDPLWYNAAHSFEDFVESWKWLVDHVKDDDTVIAVDVFNEPHGTPFKAPGAIWDDSDAPENWRKAAEDAAIEILKINPELLIMIEGIESYPKEGYTFSSTMEEQYYGNWWGGNLRGVKDYPINLGEHQDQLVYSPHDYGPAIWEQNWFKIDFTKETLINDCWYPNWFYIQDQNIAPVLIGEWGGRTDGTDHPNNMKWMTALKDFILENKINYTFWCLNDNSGDTGGIYVNDFQGIEEEKLALVTEVLWKDDADRFIGLDHQIALNSVDPSYARNGTTISMYYGDPTISPPPTPTPTPIPISPYYEQLKLQYKCGELNQEPVHAQIKPHVTLLNIGDEEVNLEDLKIYYYYTKKGFIPEAYFIDYASKIAGPDIILTFKDEEGRFEVSFAAGAGTIAAGDDSGEMLLRVSKTDYSLYDQSDDYSFSPSIGAYEDYDKMVVFYKDELVWGMPPEGLGPEPTPTPPPGIMGDVNMDGALNIIDALLIARHSVGIPVEGFHAEYADITADGIINIVDALIVARKSVGLE